MKHLNWTRTLTILLVILASYALVYITVTFLSRFSHAILLFVLGAMVAYILTPLVNRLEEPLHVRWSGILLSYMILAALITGLGVMLFTPFVDQSKSLVDNLQNPTSSSLKTITLAQRDTSDLVSLLELQQSFMKGAQRLPLSQVSAANQQFLLVERDIANLKRGVISGRSHTPPATGRTGSDKLTSYPQPQTKVPPSYAASLSVPLTRTESNYAQATSSPNAIDVAALNRAVSNAKKSSTAAHRVYHTMATTPILVLRSQTWLDQHGLKVDVADLFGQAAQQISSQGTLVLDNAITLLSDAANALLNITLILIIAFYLLNDGPRLIRKAEDLIPHDYREQGQFFFASVDRVVGGYIRGQIFLSVLAGVLGGGGAAVLGVPYPLLIGIMTAVLEAVPVIGPLVAFIPAVLISLFFMPVLTTVILAVWYVIFQQVVTNILGPRVMGIAVGIHPLEALLAVLVGYPIGSFLGAFLAVPVAGIIHILVREAYLYFAPHGAKTAEESGEAEASGAKPVHQPAKIRAAR